VKSEELMKTLTKSLRLSKNLLTLLLLSMMVATKIEAQGVTDVGGSAGVDAESAAHEAVSQHRA